MCWKIIFRGYLTFILLFLFAAEAWNISWLPAILFLWKKKWMTFHCVFLKFRLLPQLSFQLKKLCYRRWNCKSSIFEKTCTEALARWWSVKNVFLTPAACNFIKKETPLQVFSCKFRYIFLKHHFLYVTWGDCFFSSRSLINIMI